MNVTSTSDFRPPDRQSPSVHSVLSLITSAADHLRSQGFDEARLHVELLLARVLGLRRLDLYLQFDRPLTQVEVESFKHLYRRRTGHEPLQYILGDADFLGHRLVVDRRVLIPRPETELLVERAIALLGLGVPAGPRVLDIGTGSGNIAVSVAAAVPAAVVTALDLSSEALEVAAINGDRIVPGRIEYVRGDILQDVLTGRVFELILSNPPYVSADDFGQLQPEVRDFEPRLALTDGGDGLRLPLRVIEFASQHLVPGGTLLMELGVGQSDRVRAAALGAGFARAAIHPDFAGIPRVLEATGASKEGTLA